MSTRLPTLPWFYTEEGQKLDAAGSLNMIHGQWLGCTKCALHQCRKDEQIVFGHGNPNAKVMIVGEAPGALEEEWLIPFVGDSGWMLNELIAKSSDDPSIQDLAKWFFKLPRPTKDDKEHFHTQLLEYRNQTFYTINVVACFPGETQVAATGIEKGYRRFYEGPLVKVRVSSGNVLSGTPNHPVLTPRGWIPLDALREGDEVVRCAIGQEVVPRDPHVDHMPTRIDELFEALSNTGHTDRVVGAEVDFHGDGREDDVEVVTSAGVLSIDDQSALSQHLNKRSLPGSYKGFRSVEGLRAGETRLLKTLRRMKGISTLDRSTRWRRDHATLSEGHVVHAEVVGLASVPQLKTCLQQDAIDRLVPSCVTGDQERSRSTCLVGRDDLFSRQGAPPHSSGKDLRLAFRSHRDIAPPQVTADRQSAGLELIRDLNQRFPGKVELVRVTGVERIQFRGQVHNLQTPEGWYTAGELVVSNCRPVDNETPTPTQRNACWGRVHNTIYAVDPVLIIAVGKVALDTLLDKKVPILKARGDLYRAQLPGRFDSVEYNVYATLHPSYLLRIADKSKPKGAYASTVSDWIDALTIYDWYMYQRTGRPISTRGI